ncbi:MAG: type I CRISPR-associated protein Cas7 [Brevinematia bacterium]
MDILEQSKPYLKNRREILFVYSVRDANPNGDPLAENRPRYDENTGLNYVSPDRLKRTIRDQLAEFGENIFVKPVMENGMVLDRTTMAQKYGFNLEDIERKCIDVRLFGVLLAVDKERAEEEGEEEVDDETYLEFDEGYDEEAQGLFNDFKKNKEQEKQKKDLEKKRREKERRSSVILARSRTGPVQFNWGRSLHRVVPTLIKGTTVFASKPGLTQGTITERYILPYSLIAFHGVVNENAAKFTGLTGTDVNKMLKAMWIGTKAGGDILTYSKTEHIPRLLVEIVYKKGTYLHIGELDALVRVKLNGVARDEEIRDISQVVLDLTEFKDVLERYKEKISYVLYAINPRLITVPRIEEVFSSVRAFEVDFEKL